MDREVSLSNIYRLQDSAKWMDREVSISNLNIQRKTIFKTKSISLFVYCQISMPSNWDVCSDICGSTVLTSSMFFSVSKLFSDFFAISGTRTQTAGKFSPVTWPANTCTFRSQTHLQPLGIHQKIIHRKMVNTFW